MGQFIDMGEGHFRIEYGPPHGGLDTSAPAPYIAPNSLTDCENFFIVANTYVSGTWNLTNWGFGDYAPAFLYCGLGDIHIVNTTFNGDILIHVASAAGQVQAFTTTNLNLEPGPCGALTTLGQLTRLAYKNINNVTYFTGPGLAEIEKLDFSTGNLTPPIANLTQNLGAKFLFELNGRLVALNILQNVSGVLTPFPYKIAWSAPQQQYGVWNVLDGSSNPTGAGYNSLPDVEDEITGVITTGSTAYIIRRQGISEMTPLNSGNQPFNFDHLWASHKGIGSIFPNSISQYGSLGAFVSDSDIYTLGLESGLNRIGGKAKQAIFGTLAGITGPDQIWGLLTSLIINNTPELYYLICFLTSENTINPSIITFACNINTGEWTKHNTFVPSGFVFGGTFYQMYLTAIAASLITLQPNVSIPMIAIQQTLNPPLFYALFNNIALASITGGFVQFQMEELAFLNDQITIDAVGLYCFGLAGDHIQVYVNGQQFTDIITTGAWGYFKSVPDPLQPTNLNIPVTGLAPQLKLGYQNINQVIYAKAVMFGTMSQGRPI